MVDVNPYEKFKNDERVLQDNNLKILIKEIEELKDSDKNNDKIEWVFTETPELQAIEQAFNKWLFESLNKLDSWTLNGLIREIKGIIQDSNLNLNEEVKKSTKSLLNLTQQLWLDTKRNNHNFEIPFKNWKCEYINMETGEPAENITIEQAEKCFFNWLDVLAQLMEWQSERAVLSSWSLFLNNPDYKKLWWDVDIATDVDSFYNVALNKWDDGKTKLEKFVEEWKITDLKFMCISNRKEIDINDTDSIKNLIEKWDIKLDFNMPSPDWLLINCEFFPEPRWYWLIQLWTERAEWKVNSYTMNGREVKTVNEELAAMSYMINLAHEIKNNSIEWVQKWKKLKDSVRINNFLQYLSTAWINTPEDIINFIDKTKANYESQKWEEITTDKWEIINMSKYLKTGLDNLDYLKEIMGKVISMYNTIDKEDYSSWWNETTISINEFVNIWTLEIKRLCIKYGKNNSSELQTLILEKITNLKKKVDIRDPKNFAYFYEMYQLETNFISKLFNS